MTNKQRILQMVERWPDDISFDQAVYHMGVLQAIDEGLKDIEAGRVSDFDEVFDELERRCDEEGQGASIGSGRKRPGSAATKDRGAGRAKNGKILRRPAKKVRSKASS